jgi:predicted nucleotidyltransferase
MSVNSTAPCRCRMCLSVSAPPLFGGRARGDHEPGSHTDLLLITSQPTPRHLTRSNLSLSLYPYEDLVVRGSTRRSLPLQRRSCSENQGATLAFALPRTSRGTLAAAKTRKFCCFHSAGSGLSRSSTCMVGGCRPSTIASTMSGASSVSRRMRLT